MRNLFIPTLVMLVWLLGYGNSTLAAKNHTPTVELTSPLHFLTPAGDDVVLGPGTYEVEAAESWLKLVPEGGSRSTAVLLDANRGPHEEEITEAEVRTVSDPDHPELLHVALLLPGGDGLEAIGTITGIRPRGLSLAFVARKGKAQTLASRPRTSAPRPGSQTQALPPRPKGQPVNCGPFQKRIGGDIGLDMPGKRSVALVVFQNRLHMVAVTFSRFSKYRPVRHWKKFQGIYHWQYEDGMWKPYRDPSLNGDESQWGRIPNQYSKAGVALAVYKDRLDIDRLHMVHMSAAKDLRRDDNDLWHSTFDGRQWTPNVKIPGQKSKTTPALAAWNNQLHMVHLGTSSNDIWHSMNSGNGWTVNVRIPGRSSDQAPALGRVPNGPLKGRLHMVYKTDANIEPQSLWHAQYDGRQWGRSAMIRGPLTKAAPTLATSYPDGMHLIHLGKSSDDLWHMLFGTNKANGGRIEWFDERRLLSEKSEVPVGVTLFQGCYHMVSNKGDKLMHTTFSASQVHPNVR